MARTGDCYEANGRVFTEPFTRDLPDGARLVHGTVTGTAGPALGVRYGHAWIEVERESGWWVLDFTNGRDLELPRDSYYRVGSIDSDEVTRYTLEEATRALLEAGTWGPWEDHRLEHEESLETALA